MSFSQSSAEYLATLENKLSRMKGKTGKELTSKDILKSLEAVREDANVRLSLSDDTTSYYTENTELDTETVYSQIQQRIHPETVALNSEELLKLVENDELQKSSSIESNTCS